MLLADDAHKSSYAVKVDGKTVGVYQTQRLAEAAILNLQASDQQRAQIVPIQESTGHELLLG